MSHGKEAAIFLIDRNYLTAFEVFYFSLRKTGSFEGVPIIVMTTDRTLLENKFLTRVCYDIVLLSGKPAADTTVAATRHGNDEAAGYVFFKFNVFDEKRFERLYYFDADLLCLNNIDGLRREGSGVDFAGSPAFSPNHVKDADGTRRTPDQVIPKVDDYLNKNRSGMRLKGHTGLNSGVMAVGRGMQGISAALSEMATQKAYKGDQNVIADYLAHNPGISFRFLNAGYNMPRRTFDYTGVEYFCRKRDEVKILHFNVMPPWKRGDKKEFVDFIWWDAFRESRPFIERLYQ